MYRKWRESYSVTNGVSKNGNRTRMGFQCTAVYRFYTDKCRARWRQRWRIFWWTFLLISVLSHFKTFSHQSNFINLSTTTVCQTKTLFTHLSVTVLNKRSFLFSNWFQFRTTLKLTSHLWNNINMHNTFKASQVWYILNILTCFFNQRMQM